MTPSELPDISVALQEYATIWAECTSKVLEQLQGKPFTGAPQTPALSLSEPAGTTPAATAPPDLGAETKPESAAGGASEVASSAAPASTSDISIRFGITGRLTGVQMFRFSKPDGVRLAQLLMSEPVDASVEFNDGHIEALHELFRQFAAVATTACKARYGEVGFTLDAVKESEFQPAATAVWEFRSITVEPLRWSLAVDRALRTALESARPVQAAPDAATPKPDAAQAQPKPASPSSATASEVTASAANLDLLLDVVLGATLRFGQKDMLLREILELRPGSVVELNRRIQEPAELLVSGRVVARGEVVIVDGSYGLRITDIAQPHQRLESVETGGHTAEG